MARKLKGGAPSGWESVGAPANPGIVKDLAITKLLASGLDADDMERLGMAAVDNVQATELLGYMYPDAGLHIPYWDPRNPTKPLAPAPKWPQSFRIRRLPTPEREVTLTENDKKYLAPSESSLSAYFPTNMDWTEVLDDHKVDLIITEGELKAAKTCKEGYPCIGLGGVSAISSSERGITFLEVLDTINWVKRKVTVIFDSDIEVNEDVVEAHNRLVDKLKDRGADVFSAILPRTQDDGKQGLDDWFVNNPGVDFLKAVMALKVPVTEHAAMQTMRLRYVFVSAQDAVFDLKTQTLSARPAFNVAVSNTNFEVFKFDTEAMTFKARKVDLGSAYLSSPVRKTVHTMDYAPANPRFIDSLEGLEAVNTWRPRHIEPVKGDVTVFKRLLQAQVDHNDPGWEMHCRWLTQRLAYPYRFPGMKLQTAVVIYGPEGTGKSTVGEIMLQLYGSNGASVDQQALEADFNMAHANKEFLLCDEVANRRGKMDMVTRFKALITRKTMRVNGKNVKEYYARSFEQYYITTNEDDAIVMAKEDRRYFVGHNTGADTEVVRLASSIFKDPDMTKVKSLKEFEALRTKALQAIAYYLTHEVDLVDFEPYANPPRTQAKEEMTIINRSNAETFLHEAYETPGMLQELGAIAIKEKFTTFDAVHLAYGARQELGGFKPDYIGRSGFAALMKKVGFLGYKLKSGPNANKTIYPLQDHEQWTTQKVAEHFGCAAAATSGDKATYSPVKVVKAEASEAKAKAKATAMKAREYATLREQAEKIIDPKFKSQKLAELDEAYKVSKKKY